MPKEPKQPKILIDIYNAIMDIRNILIKVHKTEICPHTTVSDKIEYWAATTSIGGTEEYTVHKCLTCGQLVSIPKNKSKEVKE